MDSASHSTKFEFPNDVTHSDACLAQKFNHLRRAGSIFLNLLLQMYDACDLLVSKHIRLWHIFSKNSTYKFFLLNVLNHAYLGMAGGRGQARLPIMHSSHTQSSSIYKHTHTHTHARAHTHTQRFEHTTLLSLAWKETRNFYETKQANTFLFVLKKKFQRKFSPVIFTWAIAKEW
jgi:hypothetical protein